MRHARTSDVTQDRSNNSLLGTSHEHLRKLFLHGWPAISCIFLFKLFFLNGFFRLLFNLQPWLELLGHKGNKPVKMTYFLPPPPPDAMLMSGIQVIFGRLNIAWGKGGQKKWFSKTTLTTCFKRWIQSSI